MSDIARSLWSLTAACSRAEHSLVRNDGRLEARAQLDRLLAAWGERQMLWVGWGQAAQDCIAMAAAIQAGPGDATG